MNNLWKKIERRYHSISHLFLAHGLFAILLFLFYRFRIYRYIGTLYPDVTFTGFSDYISLSLHYDSAALCCYLALLFIILFITAGLRKARYIVLSLYSILFVFFILFSTEFFRVYETTFQKNFAGKEHFSGLGNVLDSALAEFSLEFYILFFIFSAVALAITIAICRWEAGADIHEIIEYHSSVKLFRFLLWMMPGMLVLSMLFALLTDAAAPVRARGHRYAGDRPRYLSLLREFSMNPVYNLAVPTPQHSPVTTTVPGERSPFSFRLNTDSLATNRRYARQDLIPRGKRYNIILYFFESTPYRYYNMKVHGRHVIETWHRLEKNSLNMRNHYANYPLSANALLSVLTSAYDLNTKDMLIQKYPDIRLRSLPEILKSSNYRTCLIHTGGLGYAGQRRFLKNRKFDEIMEYNDLAAIPPYNHQVGWGIDERAMIKPAADFITRGKGKPFLLVMLPVNPHHPYAIPGNEFRIAGDGGDMDYRQRNWINYLNSLSYSDVALGMLVDELERKGLMEDTLLFLFADHGEAFYQHRMNYNHPLFIYNENVHVPFLIYNKRLFPSPEYFDGVTRHIDIMPTILDILGIARSPEQEGVAILSPHREQMALLHTSWKDDFMGIADQQWKYILRTDEGFDELYNTREDPEEKKNIARDQRDVADRYRRFVMKARAYKDEYYQHIPKK